MLVCRHREGEPIRIGAAERNHSGSSTRQRTARGLGACAGRGWSRTEILKVTLRTAHDREHTIGGIVGGVHDLPPWARTTILSSVRIVAQPQIVRQRHKTRIPLGLSALFGIGQAGYARLCVR